MSSVSDKGNSAHNEPKVCFICGSCTESIINIREPRPGPNVVNLIQEKFRIQPDEKQKFLCYGCNNWLVNWHYIRNHNMEDNKPSGKYQNKKSKDSIPEEMQPCENIGDEQTIEGVRRRLKKYLYKKPNYGFNTVEITHLRELSKELNCKSDTKPMRLIRRIPKHESCFMCKKLKRKNSKNRIRRNCYCSWRKYRLNKLKISHKLKKPKRTNSSPNLNINVVEMLQRQGTTLTKDDECQCEGQVSSTTNQQELDLISNPDEICLSFDSHIAEVLKLNLNQLNDKPNQTNHNDILKRLSKSLSITLITK